MADSEHTDNENVQKKTKKTKVANKRLMEMFLEIAESTAAIAEKLKEVAVTMSSEQDALVGNPAKKQKTKAHTKRVHPGTQFDSWALSELKSFEDTYTTSESTNIKDYTALFPNHKEKEVDSLLQLFIKANESVDDEEEQVITPKAVSKTVTPTKATPKATPKAADSKTPKKK